MLSEYDEDIKEFPSKKSSILKKVAIIAGSVVVFTAIILSLIIITTVTKKDTQPKNLILLLADGFGPASLTLARIGSSRNMTLDQTLVGLVKTRSNDSWVTDSAAGATAYSCGLRTLNYQIAIDPEGKACGTLLESAQRKGFKTGIVVTSEFTHATPASFAAHAKHRDMLQFIGEQMITNNPDLIFGGGMAILKDNNEKLYNMAMKKFGKILTHKDELKGNLTLPVFGIFADNHLNYTIDKSETQPSLRAMTETALELLTRNKKDRFFLFIEGSRIDHGAHSNDIASHFHEIIAFDEALEYVVDFADKRKDTLVVVVADHETGGLTIGKDGKYLFDVEALNKIHRSIDYIVSWITSQNDFDMSTVAEAVSRFTNFTFTQDDEKYFPSLTTAGLRTGFSIYFADKTNAGWTTGGHTGVDINLHAFGKQSEQFRGVFRNDVIGRMLEKIFNFDLDAVTEELKDFDPNPPGAILTRDSIHSDNE